MTFLLLDNERYARKLLAQVEGAKSIHNVDRYVTRADHIQVWDQSFEFDNYSNTELAEALCVVSDQRHTFTEFEMAECRSDENPGSCLKKLFRQRVGEDIDKMKLSELLVELMFRDSAIAKLQNRPVIKTVNKIAELAALNPLPTTQEHWKLNQRSEFLGKSRERDTDEK